jgi:imidazoleglycerol phosphate synthase glutamine amidotransferase subunit HisH
MSNKLQWERIPMMGWTKHTATIASGEQYAIEKEDDYYFVLFFNRMEIVGVSSVKAAKSAAQSHYEKLILEALE